MQNDFDAYFDHQSRVSTTALTQENRESHPLPLLSLPAPSSSLIPQFPPRRAAALRFALFVFDQRNDNQRSCPLRGHAVLALVKDHSAYKYARAVIGDNILHVEHLYSHRPLYNTGLALIGTDYYSSPTRGHYVSTGISWFYIYCSLLILMSAPISNLNGTI